MCVCVCIHISLFNSCLKYYIYFIFLFIVACGFWFLGQGLNPGPLHWEHGVLTTGPSVCSVTQSCPALYGRMDCSPPGSSVHRILQAGILEWVAASYCRVSSRPRDRTCVSCVRCIDMQILYHQCHLGSPCMCISDEGLCRGVIPGSRVSVYLALPG